MQFDRLRRRPRRSRTFWAVFWARFGVRPAARAGSNIYALQTEQARDFVSHLLNRGLILLFAALLAGRRPSTTSPRGGCTDAQLSRPGVR